ncbi:MAG: hypothetical protein ACR2GW_01760 [Pyrinomonadaceae bacterium]
MRRTTRHFFLSTSLLLSLTFILAPVSAQDEPANGPAYRDYKGVQIGMSTEEARRKLGDPQEKGEQQDFYVFSEKETAQVFYDDAKKVMAVAVIYVGKDSGAPECRKVLGADIEAKPDGSMHQLTRYPKAGYWVSYSRTTGDSPITSVTMQKLKP